MLSNMKTVNAREFQKQFGKIAESLQEEESICVTKHGKVIGQFTKPPSRKIPCPDFAAILERTATYPIEVGNEILKKFNDSLS